MRGPLRGHAASLSIDPSRDRRLVFRHFAVGRGGPPGRVPLLVYTTRSNCRAERDLATIRVHAVASLRTGKNCTKLPSRLHIEPKGGGQLGEIAQKLHISSNTPIARMGPNEYNF